MGDFVVVFDRTWLVLTAFDFFTVHDTDARSLDLYIKLALDNAPQLNRSRLNKSKFSDPPEGSPER
jgi:hypothetical protein